MTNVLSWQKRPQTLSQAHKRYREIEAQLTNHFSCQDIGHSLNSGNVFSDSSAKMCKENIKAQLNDVVKQVKRPLLTDPGVARHTNSCLQLTNSNFKGLRSKNMFVLAFLLLVGGR